MSAQVSVIQWIFTRPANTTAYASGDLVANSTTASAVIPMPFKIGDKMRGGLIRRVRLRKSGTSITNAQFRLHLYRSGSITCANGDNGAWSTNRSLDYAGAFDVTCDRVFTDGAVGNGIPLLGSEIGFNADTYFGLLEARAAYTPVSAEVFDLELEVVRN
jgi:hypothetical protein